MGVRIKSRHVVVPAEPTWQGILSLSELDQVDVISHTSVLYFYDRPTREDWVDASTTKVVSTLKESLSRVLVHFYPLAGRLSWMAGNRLELECNAMGTELVEVDSVNKVSDFGDFVDCSKSMFKDLITHIDYINTPLKEIPLLSVQVTGFACGGICLGIQFSHVLMDGRSVFHFLKEWARLTRGEPLEVAPYLDRMALKHSTSSVDQPVDAGHASFSQVADTYLRENVPEETSQLLLPTLVLMSGDQIECLKKVANHNHVSDMHCRPYSRFEVITAHVWKCMTKARELDADDTTALYVIADGRTCLNPPLPSSYFGNVVVPVTVSSTAGELVTRPLSYACGKVREAVKQLTNEYIKDAIEFFGKEKSLRNHQFIDDRGDLVGSCESSNDMWVTCSLNLLAQGLDFGWGIETYAGPPTGLSDDGDTLILPHFIHDGSVKLAIWLQGEEKCKNFVDFCVATPAN